jgi:hypothetical protein
MWHETYRGQMFRSPPEIQEPFKEEMTSYEVYAVCVYKVFRMLVQLSARAGTAAGYGIDHMHWRCCIFLGVCKHGTYESR